MTVVTTKLKVDIPAFSQIKSVSQFVLIHCSIHFWNQNNDYIVLLYHKKPLKYKKKLIFWTEKVTLLLKRWLSFWILHCILQEINPLTLKVWEPFVCYPPKTKNDKNTVTSIILGQSCSSTFILSFFSWQYFFSDY